MRLMRLAAALAIVGIASFAGAQTRSATQADQDEVVTINAAFFDEWNAADSDALYDRYFAETLKSTVTRAQWADVLRGLRADAGRIAEWRFPKITWYDLKAATGQPGVAAAIDLAGRATSPGQPSRYLCGYVIWKQTPVGYDVLRFEFSVYDPAQVAGRPAATVNRVLASLKCPFRVNG